MADETQTTGDVHEVVRVHEDGLPVYRLGDRPDHLLTRRELTRAGLARAYRQPHLAHARWYYYKQEGEPRCTTGQLPGPNGSARLPSSPRWSAAAKSKNGRLSRRGPGGASTVRN